MEQQKLCACGCGQPLVPQWWHKYRDVRYIYGHRQNVSPLRQYTPTPDEIPSGLCECGCGKATEIAKNTLRSRRHFRGHPLPFLQHHTMAKSGPASHKWKGGRYLHHGYVQIYQPQHPDADTFGYVAEHRYVMEQTLGRPLVKGEIVHHINHVPGDNRPENLMLMSRSEHSTYHDLYWHHQYDDEE
jgi:hypothetical protein